MEKSKSGRVRKKPKKFVDYESPGEIDNVATVDQRQQKKVKKKVSYLNVEKLLKPTGLGHRILFLKVFT